MSEERTRLRRLLANTTTYAAGEIAVQALFAFFMPLLTLLLAPAELGVWSMAMMVLVGLNNLYNPALHGAITRFYFDHEDDRTARRRFQGTIVSFLLVWSLLLTTALFAGGSALFELVFVDFPFYPYGPFVAWMALATVVGVVPRANWIAAERPRIFVVVNMLANLIHVGGSLCLVAFTGLGVLGLFWGRSVSVTVIAVPFLVLTLRQVGLAWSPSDLKHALLFSIPLVPHLIAHWLLGMSDRLLIERLVGIDAVGIYGSAYVFIEGVNLIATAVNRAWFPLFTRAYSSEGERPFIARGTTYLIMAVGGGAVALTILSPSVVRGFYADRYAEAATIAPVLALGGFFQGLHYVYINGIFYHKRTGVLPLITLGSAAINIGLNLLWIPSHGVIGAAWATLLGYITLTLGARWACRRLTRLPFETGRLARLAVVGIGCCAGGMLLEWGLGLWAGIAAKLGLLALGVASLKLLGFWSSEELAWIRAKLFRRPGA